MVALSTNNEATSARPAKGECAKAPCCARVTTPASDTNNGGQAQGELRPPSPSQEDVAPQRYQLAAPSPPAQSSPHAEALQHRRPVRARPALHAPARAPFSRGPRAHRTAGLLRAARAEADRQNHDAPSAGEVAHGGGTLRGALMSPARRPPSPATTMVRGRSRCSERSVPPPKMPSPSSCVHRPFRRFLTSCSSAPRFEPGSTRVRARWWCSSTRLTPWWETPCSACCGSCGLDSLGGLTTSPGRSSCAGCGMSATTSLPPAATLLESGPRARSTSRSNRAASATSRSTTVRALYAQHTAETGQPFTRRGSRPRLRAHPGSTLAGERARARDCRQDEGPRH